jgi:hypothetical protein
VGGEGAGINLSLAVDTSSQSKNPDRSKRKYVPGARAREGRQLLVIKLPAARFAELVETPARAVRSAVDK